MTDSSPGRPRAASSPRARPRRRRARSRRQTLHVYTWADYVKPELVQRFEKEHGCRVVIDTFDSNEAMYAKIKAGRDRLRPASPRRATW